MISQHFTQKHSNNSLAFSLVRQHGTTLNTGDATRVNLRTGVRNDRYDVSLFVNNLTDDDTFMAIRRFTDFHTFQQAFWAGLPLPREFGVTFRLNF